MDAPNCKKHFFFKHKKTKNPPDLNRIPLSEATPTLDNSSVSNTSLFMGCDFYKSASLSYDGLCVYTIDVPSYNMEQ